MYAFRWLCTAVVIYVRASVFVCVCIPICVSLGMPLWISCVRSWVRDCGSLGRGFFIYVFLVVCVYVFPYVCVVMSCVISFARIVRISSVREFVR